MAGALWTRHHPGTGTPTTCPYPKPVSNESRMQHKSSQRLASKTNLNQKGIRDYYSEQGLPGHFLPYRHHLGRWSSVSPLEGSCSTRPQATVLFLFSTNPLPHQFLLIPAGGKQCLPGHHRLKSCWKCSVFFSPCLFPPLTAPDLFHSDTALL